MTRSIIIFDYTNASFACLFIILIYNWKDYKLSKFIVLILLQTFPNCLIWPIKSLWTLDWMKLSLACSVLIYWYNMLYVMSLKYVMVDGSPSNFTSWINIWIINSLSLFEFYSSIITSLLLTIDLLNWLKEKSRSDN